MRARRWLVRRPATTDDHRQRRLRVVPLALARDHSGKIDLLYLDSYDVDWNDPHASALHHLMELCAAMPALRSGSLVAVDDHLDMENRPGKSKYIVPFMAAIHAKKLFEAYQIGWIIP